MSRAFAPREYQKIAVDFMLDTPRCALFAGMGLGKTVSTLNALDTLAMCGFDGPTLALGPLRVARDTWPDETRKWNHLKHLKVSAIVGTPQERRRALKAKADLYTMNYEQLPWLVEEVGAGKWPFRNIVADECTRLKGFRLKQGGQRTRALGQVARQTERWINLTGTPAPNGLKDLWGQFWFLDFGERLGRTYSSFTERWFRTDYNGFSLKPYPHAEKEIYARIDDITLSIRPEDWFDLDEPIERVVRVKMPKGALKRYKQLEKEMFTELVCGTEVEVFNAAALTNKCLQFANGAIYTDYPKWSPVHDCKLEALESIVEEAGGAPMLVAYEFVSDRERLLKTFKSAVDISTQAGLAEFKSGAKSIGIAHPQSMGHGIDGLQDVCNILVYFGHNWNLELRQQILERIGPVRQMQSGLNRPVWVYSIVTEETLDDTVIARHKSKRNVQDLLLEAMTRRGGGSDNALLMAHAMSDAVTIFRGGER
jgi:SNF2 family DNA or RNA helicase